MAGKVGLYPAGVHRRAPNPAITMATVELHSEQDVGRLGAAVGGHGIIVGPVRAGIVQIYVDVAVAGRGEDHQSSALAHQRRNGINQDEVAEMVGPELRLEAVGGEPLRAGHDARIGDHHVEGLPPGQEGVGASPHVG